MLWLKALAEVYMHVEACGPAYLLGMRRLEVLAGTLKRKMAECPADQLDKCLNNRRLHRILQPDVQILVCLACSTVRVG